jgi:U3 small nucleolar ribonucleoprotein component
MTFDELLRALLAVGKRELDRAEKRYRKKKAKRKKSAARGRSNDCRRRREF